MHTYVKSLTETLWTVGFFAPDKYSGSSTPVWHAVKDFAVEVDAAAFTSYLNGGEDPSKPWPPAAI